MGQEIDILTKIASVLEQTRLNLTNSQSILWYTIARFIFWAALLLAALLTVADLMINSTGKPDKNSPMSLIHHYISIFKVDQLILIFVISFSGLITYAKNFRDRNGVKVEKNNSRNIDILYRVSLVLILLIGFIIRVLYLGDQSFWVDELWHVNEALGLNTYDRAALITLINKLIIGIFGPSELYLRIAAVLTGVAVIYLTYLFAGQTTNRKTALLACMFVSVSPLFIGWSRENREYIYITFFSLLLAYSIVRLYKKFEPKMAFVLAVALLGLIFTNPYPLIMAILILLMLFIDKINFDRIKAHGSVISIGILISIFIFWQYSWVIKGGSGHVFSDYLFYLKDISTHEPLLLILYLGFVSTTIYNFIKSGYSVNKLSSLSLVFVFVTILFSLLPRQGVRYILFVYPLFIIGASYFIVEIFRLSKTRATVMIALSFLVIAISHNFWAYDLYARKLIDPKAVAKIMNNKNEEKNYRLREIYFYHNDYKEVYGFYRANYSKNTMIIMESPQVEKFYARLYGIDCKRQYMYTAKKKLIYRAKKNKIDTIFITFGHRFFTKKNFDKDLVSMILSKGTVIKEFNGLKILRVQL